MGFQREFFRHYDRAIRDGICTFRQLGVSANDFTHMCTTADFIIDDESILRASDAMKLTIEERENLLHLARLDRVANGEIEE